MTTAKLSNRKLDNFAKSDCARNVLSRNRSHWHIVRNHCYPTDDEDFNDQFFRFLDIDVDLFYLTADY